MKVRIKRKTRPGDQVDYSLATGNMYGHINDDAYPNKDPFIKDTLSKVPREEANIEAEGGETVLGDINEDGLMEHSKIVGKRHSKGGVPLNVPDGSFLFSDTPKLKIKDKDVIEYFGKRSNKKGYTPAQLAKNFDLNKHNEVLKDPKATRIEKDTAARMIADNTRKLSELAMIQESMKGMPNGVPSFVESVMGNPQEAQFGGMIKDHKKVHIPIVMQDGSEYPRTDIRSYGAVGRGLHKFDSFIKDASQYHPGFLAAQALYDNVKQAVDPVSPMRIKVGEMERGLGNFIYDMFLNPVQPAPKKVEKEKEPVFDTEEEFNTTKPSEKSKGSTDGKIKGKIIKSVDDVFKKGGQYQDGGATYTPYNLDGQQVYVITYPDGRKQMVDAQGKILKDSQTPVTSQSNQPTYTRYGNKTFDPIIQELDKTGNVIHSEQDFGEFGSQSRVGDTGLYGTDEYMWEDLKTRHGDWIEEMYPDGFDQFVQDVQNSEMSSKTTRWFQNKINEFSVDEFDKKYFTPENGSPYGVDGLFGRVTFSVPRFFKINQSAPEVTETTPATTAQKPAPEVVTKQEEKIMPGVDYPNELRQRDGRWYIQDTLNLANTLVDDVNVYTPQRQQVDFEAPDATYMDPSRQLASIQEQQARFQDLAQNTASGSIARSNVLGSSGEAGRQAADVIANYENQNVQIANQNAAQRSDVENRERMANVELADKYNTGLAVVSQQRDNALRELRQRRLNAFNQGLSNNHRKKMMEQVLFPQVSVDSVTGDWFTTNGRDLTDVIQTYTNPAFGGGATMNPAAQAFGIADQMLDLKNELINKGRTPEEAEWAAGQAAKNIKTNFNTSNNLYMQQMANMLPNFDF